MRDYSAVPWATQREDSNGHRFEFQYRGGSMVKIHDAVEDEDTGVWVADRANRFAIDLNNYGLADKVTEKWLANRADEWITDRNADIANGTLRPGE